MARDSSLHELARELRTFTDERDWSGFHDPKNLSMLVASEAGELLSLFRWVSNSEAGDFVKNTEHRARIADEMGDVAISLLLFCDRVGLDLIEAAAQKMEKNRQDYPADEFRGRSDRIK